MNRSIFKFIFCSPILLISFFSHAQVLDTTLANYAAKYQQEKAYLHYDKSSYSPGETIWFKAYLMEDLFPAQASKTLYTDWIADNGQVLSHTVSPLVDGATAGQFDIPADYTGTAIHVRAYTRWMLNFDTAFLYSKDIHILAKTTQSKSVRPAAVSTLSFFPEGGDAVAGLQNKIAFKANDQWGNPVKVRGVVVDSKGAAIDSFRSVHDGMGYIIFTPEQGVSYTAKWRDEKGAVHTTPLPSMKSSGVVMQVKIQNGRRVITISSNSPDENLKRLHLVGTMNQRQAFTNSVSMNAVSVDRIIPTAGLPSGILTITLFDANWNAIAERITFINNHDFSFQPQMEVNHWGLSKRGRNELQITIPDSLQGANLSIAVTDAAIEKDTSDNIVSHFLLTSDIKGKVNNASYYFSNNSDSATEYLDLVMLTNGWRRFKWEDVTKGRYPVITFPRDTTYMTLSGQLYGVAKSQLSGTESLVLLIKTKDSAAPKMDIVGIDRNGTFNDPNMMLFDTVHIYYSLKSKFLSSAEATFMPNRLPAPNYSAFSKTFVNSPLLDTAGSAYHNYLSAEMLRQMQLQKGKMLENVTIKTKARTPVQEMEDKYPSGLFKGGDGYQFDIMNDQTANSGFPDILSYLQGRVAGLQITMSSGQASLTWRGGTPQLYLDEMQADASMITSIPVSDIAYVKVFRPPFMGGQGGGNGAIAIYTKRGNDVQNTSSKGLSNNVVAGYSPIKQFYSPNYDTFNAQNEQPDERTTLYWNPILLTNAKTHSLTVTFYNNDVAKSFRVVIEGMSKEGLLTHFEQIME